LDQQIPTNSETTITEPRGEEKESNLFQSIARLNDMYLYSEDETENAEIQKLEDEIFEWIEDNGFTEAVKKYFGKISLMFS
jgi:hypothetical protein